MSETPRLEPFRKLSRTLKHHFHGILAYFETRLTNAAIEAVNGLLQMAKRIARGFRNFHYFRVAAYLKAGRLNLQIPHPLPLKRRRGKKALGILPAEMPPRASRMEKLENQYGADALSEALEVSESGFATHRSKQDGQRWKEDAELRVLIAQSFEQSRNTFILPLPSMAVHAAASLTPAGERCSVS